MQRKKRMPEPMLVTSRQLRQKGTRAEALLWEHLRDRQLHGAKFRRQAVIGRFIVDFYCHEHRLVVELDGAVHDQPDIAAHDAERQEQLEAQGYRVLRGLVTKPSLVTSGMCFKPLASH